MRAPATRSPTRRTPSVRTTPTSRPRVTRRPWRSCTNVSVDSGRASRAQRAQHCRRDLVAALGEKLRALDVDRVSGIALGPTIPRTRWDFTRDAIAQVLL